MRTGKDQFKSPFYGRALRALYERELCMIHDVAECQASIAFRSEKASVQRRNHTNFAPNSREKIAKFPKIFGAPRAEKLRELDQRGCAKRIISLQLFCESV